MEHERLKTYNKESLKNMALDQGLTRHGFNGRTLSRMRKKDFIDFIVEQNRHESRIEEDDILLDRIFHDLIIDDTFQPILHIIGALGLGIEPPMRMIRSLSSSGNLEEERIPNEEDESIPDLSLVDLKNVHKSDCKCEICSKNNKIINENLKVKESIHNIETKLSCTICLTNMRNVVFHPCNHLATCITCSKHPLLNKCPLCRKTYEKTTRIFC